MRFLLVFTVICLASTSPLDAQVDREALNAQIDVEIAELNTLIAKEGPI